MMEEKACILIADDEKFIRKLMSRILPIESYEILQAENGEEAIETFHKHHSKIVLVILDIRMPDKSGIDVFHCLVSLNPQVRVILCSGYEDDIFSAENCGFFIRKPFSIKDFQQLVQKIVNLDGDKVQEFNEKLLRNFEKGFSWK